MNIFSLKLNFSLLIISFASHTFCAPKDISANRAKITSAKIGLPAKSEEDQDLKKAMDQLQEEELKQFSTGLQNIIQGINKIQREAGNDKLSKEQWQEKMQEVFQDESPEAKDAFDLLMKLVVFELTSSSQVNSEIARQKMPVIEIPAKMVGFGTLSYLQGAKRNELIHALYREKCGSDVQCKTRAQDYFNKLQSDLKSLHTIDYYIQNPNDPKHHAIIQKREIDYLEALRKQSTQSAIEQFMNHTTPADDTKLAVRSSLAQLEHAHFTDSLTQEKLELCYKKIKSELEKNSNKTPQTLTTILEQTVKQIKSMTQEQLQKELTANKTLLITRAELDTLQALTDGSLWPEELLKWLEEQRKK